MGYAYRCRIISAGLIALILPAAVQGCGDAGSETARGGAVSARPATLKETYEFLRVRRASRAYGDMRPYLDPAAYRPMIDLLMAVDELLAANDAAMAVFAEVCSGRDAAALDLSDVANQLELFSREVAWVSSREDEERGIVTVQVANRVPLIDLAFVRRDDRWVYLPDLEDDGVAAGVQGIARGLERLVQSVKPGTTTCDEAMRDYDIRVRTPLRRMAASDRTAGPGRPDDPSR